MRSIPSILLSLWILSAPAFGSWTLVIWQVNQTTVWEIPAQIGFFSSREAKIHGVSGEIEGYAWCRANTLASAQVALVGTSYEYELYQHLPPGVGEVELAKTTRMMGRVELQYGPGAAACLGHATASHKFDAAPWLHLQSVVAIARTTSEHQLLNVGITGGGVGGSLPLSITRGHGSFPDDGNGVQTEFASACPVATYQNRKEAHLDLQTSAFSDLFQVFQSWAAAEGEGVARIEAILLTLPRCP